MGHRRAGLLLTLLASSALADQGPPVYTATGTKPVAGGACSGPRVQVGYDDGALWCCVASQWTACGSSAGGAPTTAHYVTTQAEAGLSAEAVLPTCSGTDKLTFNGTTISCATDQSSTYTLPDATSLVTGGIRLTGDLGGTATSPTVPGLAGKAPSTSGTSILLGNGSGGFSSYAGTTCTGANLLQVLSSTGAGTCLQLRLDQLANPTGDSTVTYPTGKKVLWTFTGSTDEAFTIHGDGAFTGTGDLVHIHKSGTGATAGADALHVEVDSDTNMTGIRVTMANSTRDAINTNAKVTASGGFVGALTGNASTATALSTAGGANQFWKNGNTWAQPDWADLTGKPATFAPVDATAAVTGGVRLTGDLGGTATSPTVPGLSGKAATVTCGANTWASTLGSGTSSCTQPAFGSISGTATSSQLPAATTALGAVKMAAACGAGNHVSSIGAGGELTCTADSGGAGGSPGGSTTQVQFNNAGAFGGATNVKIVSNNLTLLAVSTPSTPAAGEMVMYGKARAGRIIPTTISPDGAQHTIQEALFSNMVQIMLPNTGTTVPLAFGNTWTGRASTGTLGHPTPATTNRYTKMRRMEFTTGAVAGQGYGIQGTLPMNYLGNAANEGGFFFFARFGFTTLNATGQRLFIGLTTQNAAYGATEPSTVNNTVGICKDSTDAAASFCTRNTAVTKNSSATFTLAANVIYDFTMSAAPNSTTIYYRLVDETNGTVIWDNLSTSTTPPTVNTLMYPWAWIGSSAASTQVMGVNKVYVASDF